MGFEAPLTTAIEPLVAEAVRRCIGEDPPFTMRAFMKFNTADGLHSSGYDRELDTKRLIDECIEDGVVSASLVDEAVEAVADRANGYWARELSQRKPGGYWGSFAWEAFRSMAAGVVDACAVDVSRNLALDAALARFERFCAADSVAWCERVALLGVKVIDGPHKLSENTTICTADNNFHRVLWAEHGPAHPELEESSYFTERQMRLVMLTDAVLEIEKQTIDRTYFPELHDVTDSNLAMSALRVHGAQRISPVIRWHLPPRDGYGLTRALRSHMSLDLSGWLPKSPSLIVDTRVASSLRAWMARRSAAPRPSALDFAIQRLDLSDERRSDDDRLVDAWIAFESLLSKPSGEGSELSYRIPLRLAMLLGNSPAERKEIRSLARRSYALRSKIVHGTLPDQRAKKFNVGEITQQTEELLRRTLQVWVASSFETPEQAIESLEDLFLGEESSTPAEDRRR